MPLFDSAVSEYWRSAGKGWPTWNEELEPEKRMIASDVELRATLDRIARFYEIVLQIRRTETSAANYHASAGGFLAEIDRMQLEVREYLSTHPSELAAST